MKQKNVAKIIAVNVRDFLFQFFFSLFLLSGFFFLLFTHLILISVSIFLLAKSLIFLFTYLCVWYLAMEETQSHTIKKNIIVIILY